MNKVSETVTTVLWESDDKECQVVIKQTGVLFAELIDRTWDATECYWTQDSNVFLCGQALAKLTTLLNTEVQSDDA
jgi:hypothetical protein